MIFLCWLWGSQFVCVSERTCFFVEQSTPQSVCVAVHGRDLREACQRTVYLHATARRKTHQACQILWWDSKLAFFLTFLDHLLVQAGHYFCHPVLSILCHVFSQFVFFFMSSFMLSLHLFFGWPPLLLFDFAQMWLCSRLKQWPNHFSLVFQESFTGLTWASFLMSSFLMWSNLVFPLTHLNILISAEFGLVSSFNP